MKFPANTASEFMKNANKKYGGASLGETSATTNYKAGGFKDGKLVKLEFTMAITMDWAEPGGGSPDDVNKKAIAEISRLTKEHEQNHKDSYEKAYDDWDPKAEAKKLMDQTFKSKAEAEKACQAAKKELDAALLKACLALHAKEGLIEMTQTIDVDMKAAGAGGCR